jgi:hypothetical protein
MHRVAPCREVGLLVSGSYKLCRALREAKGAGTVATPHHYRCHYTRNAKKPPAEAGGCCVVVFLRYVGGAIAAAMPKMA